MRRIRTVFKRFSAEFRGARLFGKHGLLRRSPIVPEIAAGLVLVLLIASAGATGVLNRVSLSSYPDFFAENAEFSVLEIPPSDAGLDKNVSNEVFSVIGPSILSQDVQSLIPTILLHYRIKYVTFYDTAFVSFFEPFLSPRAGDTETPRIDKVDGAKLSREREKSFLSIGDGWYRNEKGDSGVYRWIERSATLHFFIPQGGLSEAPTILAFSSQHQPGDGDLDILLNKEKIATVSFSNTYSDMYVELKGLQEGDNVITLTSVDKCSVAGGGDPRCLSFAFKDIKLLDAEQIPGEGIIRYNGFYPEAALSESSVNPPQWMSAKADIQIFTLNPQRVFVSFDAVSYAKNRRFTVQQDGKEVQTLALAAGAFQRVAFPLELKDGNTKLDLISEGCDQPSLVEGNGDERCLGVQIKSLLYETLQ